MKPVFRICLLSAALLVGSCTMASGADSSKSPARIDPASLRTVPDGNYLVTLEMGGEEKKLNLKIEGNRARCVNSSDPALRSVRGEFQPYGSGAFVARFQDDNDFRATQLWIFRADGVAAIRETPDRGEIQSAVPVQGDTLRAPAKRPGRSD